MKAKSWAPIVKLRTYFIHAIIVLIVLVVDVFVFQFLAEAATGACAEIKRASDAPHSEIVFSSASFGEDSFYYLKQQHIVGTKNTNVSCDIFMIAPDRTYGQNDIYFRGSLESGTCAVSKNLARKYGLQIGDSARISGTDKTFVVSGYLTAQAGLDKDYLHEGIIVLSFDEELLERQYSFVSFATDGDEYPGLISLVFIEDWAAESARKLGGYAAAVLAVFVATTALCEWSLFFPRRRDYPVLVSLGRTTRGLFWDIWIENVFKYALPPAVLAAGYAALLSSFGAMYALPILCYIGINIICITVYSLILTRRFVACRAKTRKS